MNTLRSTRQSIARLKKICFSCTGIVAATIALSGLLKLSMLDTTPQFDRLTRLLHPLAETAERIVERRLF